MLLWLQFEVAISDEEMALFHDTSGGEAELLFRFAAKMRELLGFDDLDRRGNILEPASMGVKDCETSTAEENLVDEQHQKGKASSSCLLGLHRGDAPLAWQLPYTAHEAFSRSVLEIFRNNCTWKPGAIADVVASFPTHWYVRRDERDTNTRTTRRGDATWSSSHSRKHDGVDVDEDRRKMASGTDTEVIAPPTEEEWRTLLEGDPHFIRARMINATGRETEEDSQRLFKREIISRQEAWTDLSVKLFAALQRIDYIPRMVTITGNADFLRVHTLLPKLLGAPGASSTREEQAETSNLDQHVDADVEVAKRALRELVPKQPPLAVLAQLLYDVAVEEFPEQEQQDGPATLWKKSHLQIPEVVHLALWPYKKPNRPWLQWQTLRQMESTERLVFITDIEAARFTAILAASSSGRVEQCNKKSDPDASRRTWPPPRAEQAYAFRKIWVTTPTGLHALASTNAECWAPPFGRKLAPPEIHPPSLVQASYHNGHEEDDISPTVAYVADEHEAENYYDAAPLAEHEQTGLWKARTRSRNLFRSPWIADALEESRMLPRAHKVSWHLLQPQMLREVLSREVRARALLFAEAVIVQRSAGGIHRVVRKNAQDGTPAGHRALEQLLTGGEFPVVAHALNNQESARMRWSVNNMNTGRTSPDHQHQATAAAPGAAANISESTLLHPRTGGRLPEPGSDHYRRSDNGALRAKYDVSLHAGIDFCSAASTTNADLCPVSPHATFLRRTLLHASDGLHLGADSENLETFEGLKTVREWIGVLVRKKSSSLGRRPLGRKDRNVDREDTSSSSSDVEAEAPSEAATCTQLVLWDETINNGGKTFTWRRPTINNNN